MNDDDRRRWFALVVLCLGDLMIVLDVTIVGVALPSVREDLGFSETSLAWVVNAYLLTFGGFLLLGGRLGDLFGHRRLFLIGISLFTLASLGCGLANSREALIGARAVQGLGGAVVSALALSLIINLFTKPDERAKAMGVFGFVGAGGGSIGVLLGGILTDTLDWHWIFLVNIPIGIAVFALCLVLLPGGGGHPTGRLDVAGALTVTASLMLAVYAIVNGNEAGWASTQTVGLLAAAAALLALFLTIEGRVAPALPAAQRLNRQRGRRALGGRHVRLVLPHCPLPPAGARLQPAPGRSRLPAGQHDHGSPLARPLGQARAALRHPAAAYDRTAAGRRRARALRPRSGERHFCRRCAAEHDSARPRRRDGFQPSPARGHERRRAERIRTRLGHRQHVIHDGRRTRTRL